ncbi:unnamed protein product [Soboliphyme baturini]|uniref:Uncharacterized protein n=1 Tax=Soboliphyme baturini TaxID=241478 RepID=A0A183IUE5_9BILA|nr:unnamed protein product [Soboliphyme baturini]
MTVVHPASTGRLAAVANCRLRAPPRRAAPRRELRHPPPPKAVNSAMACARYLFIKKPVSLIIPQSYRIVVFVLVVVALRLSSLPPASSDVADLCCCVVAFVVVFWHGPSTGSVPRSPRLTSEQCLSLITEIHKLRRRPLAFMEAFGERVILPSSDVAAHLKKEELALNVRVAPKTARHANDDDDDDKIGVDDDG